MWAAQSERVVLELEPGEPIQGRLLDSFGAGLLSGPGPLAADVHGDVYVVNGNTDEIFKFVQAP